MRIGQLAKLTGADIQTIRFMNVRDCSHLLTVRTMATEPTKRIMWRNCCSFADAALLACHWKKLVFYRAFRSSRSNHARRSIRSLIDISPR